MNQPITKGPKLPWGKHKGEFVRAQDTGMLDWIVNKSEYPDWVKTTAKNELSKRQGPTNAT